MEVDDDGVGFVPPATEAGIEGIVRMIDGGNGTSARDVHHTVTNPTTLKDARAATGGARSHVERPQDPGEFKTRSRAGVIPGVVTASDDIRARGEEPFSIARAQARGTEWGIPDRMCILAVHNHEIDAMLRAQTGQRPLEEGDSGFTDDVADEENAWQQWGRQHTAGVPQPIHGDVNLTPRRYPPRMRISVIVPTHQRPNSVRHALQSLQRQVHQDWEAIVIDDGDGRGAAAALALGEARIHARRNPGCGQVDARNAAIGQASGEVIMWLDDDDWLEDPHHLDAVIAQLRLGESLVSRGGWLVETDPGDTVVPIERGRTPFDLATTTASLRRDNTLLTAGLAYPISLHRKLGLLDATLDGYFDWDWSLRVTGAGVPLRRLAGLGVAYRQHPGNRSRAVTEDRRQRFARLAAKHELAIVLKDHAGVLAEREQAAA